MELNLNLLFPSATQIKVWKIFKKAYYEKFSQNTHQWEEYLSKVLEATDFIDVNDNILVPNPSGEGVLRISSELAEKILVLGGLP
jgi:hypothetical protein